MKTSNVKAGATIHERMLTNGMKVILAERHLDPVVAVMVWYRVGARNETEREAGVSHFLEHMMFKGSRSFAKGEVDLVTTKLGGTNNAFTSPDHTAYWFELASDRWEKALEIEADRMQHLALDAREFDAEKAVVLEELSMGEDEPWRVLSQLVGAAVFPRHPYRRPVIGHADTLKALSAAEMRAYYRRFYHPGNATIVVCGDVDPAVAFERIDHWFGGIEAGPRYEEVDVYRPPTEAPRGEQRLAMTWDDPGKRLCIAWPGAQVGTPADFGLDLVSTVLTGGRLSRLHRRLVLEKGLATSISTHNDARVEPGAFWLYAECAQAAKLETLEHAIDVELARLREDLVPAKELDRAKRIIAAGEAYDSETASDLAEEIGEYAVDAHWRLSLETVARIRAVTPKELREHARAILRPDARVVGVCTPKPKVKAAAASPKPRARATSKAKR